MHSSYQSLHFANVPANYSEWKLKIYVGCVEGGEGVLVSINWKSTGINTYLMEAINSEANNTTDKARWL